MANPLNVYKGPDSVRDFFNPDTAPPLPLVEVPDCLNPYRQDGVRMYAKMMTMHPANNIKSMPGKWALSAPDDPSSHHYSAESSRKERRTRPDRDCRRVQLRIDCDINGPGGSSLPRAE